MRLYGFLAITACLGLAVSLPVTQKKKEEELKKEEHKTEEDLSSVLEYERYLKEVVEALESDPDFRKKLENAPEVDIRSGKIAQELEYVGHHVRSKLDEIKRAEMNRLRELVKKQYEQSNNLDTDHMKIQQMVHHLDHTNEHTFEIDDLQKLIKKTSSDLAEADKKRREEFKQYEMQKEFEKNALEKEMDEESKKRYEEELKAKKEKHNKHEKLHHPGNKAQLEEVWEKQDHMDPEDFDPKTFFMMHDVDSNGYWDEAEVKALFVKELDKVYQSGIPEDDMRERAEEMERMREHVFSETDTNRDGLISYQEFLDQTKRDEFKKDQEWETVDNQPQFTHEEYLEFERKRQEEIQKLIAQGVMPPHPQMPYGYHANGQPNIPPGHLPPPHYQQQGQQYPQHPGVPVQLNQNQVYEHHPQGQQFQPQYVPQQQGQIHQQVPQQQYQQVPQQQYQQPQQVPQQQYQQGQIPPQQQQQYQQPQYQQVPQQVPQQQVPQGQVPQQQQQGLPQQQPQQGQQQQGQVPQQQAPQQQQGQVPQQQAPQQGQVPQQGQIPQQQNNPNQGQAVNSNSIH